MAPSTNASQHRLALYGLGLAVIVVILDQATKMAVLAAGLDGHPIAILPIFNIILVWNHGISFGMFNRGQYLPPALFAGVSGLIALGFVYWLVRASTLLQALALGLVVGGAIGNIIDRFRLGAVVDFLDFHINNIHWPAFNVADSGVVLGIALLLFDSLLCKRPEARSEAALEQHDEE